MSHTLTTSETVEMETTSFGNDFDDDTDNDGTGEVSEAQPLFFDEEDRQKLQLEQERLEASPEYIKTTMMQFFRGKRSKDGTVLQEHDVCTEENIGIVRQLSVADAVDVLYAALQENGYTGWDFIFCMNLHNECAKAGILKTYSGGIMVVYLKLVMGYEL